MKLYHGTNENSAREALAKGLLPRSDSKHIGNWHHTVESHLDFVYLTSAYAPYFAACASKENERWAIIEIDLNKLDEDKFYPDEDYLEQVSRNHIIKGLNAKSLHNRTKWFKNNIERFKDHWADSLAHIGNIAYKGLIPKDAITAVSLFDPKSNYYIASMCVDPMISILNFCFLSNKYINLTDWFFKREVDPVSFGFVGAEAYETIRQYDIKFAEEVINHIKGELLKTEGLELL